MWWLPTSPTAPAITTEYRCLTHLNSILSSFLFYSCSISCSIGMSLLPGSSSYRLYRYCSVFGSHRLCPSCLYLLSSVMHFLSISALIRFLIPVLFPVSKACPCCLFLCSLVLPDPPNDTSSTVAPECGVPLMTRASKWKPAAPCVCPFPKIKSVILVTILPDLVDEQHRETQTSKFRPLKTDAQSRTAMNRHDPL